MMMVFMFMGASCSEATPDFVVPAPGTGGNGENYGNNGNSGDNGGGFTGFEPFGGGSFFDEN